MHEKNSLDMKISLILKKMKKIKWFGCKHIYYYYYYYYCYFVMHWDVNTIAFKILLVTCLVLHFKYR